MLVEASSLAHGELFWIGEICMSGPQPDTITVSVPQRAVLERLLRQHSCPQSLALRARIVLTAASGARNEPLARQLDCSVITVRKWRTRWAQATSQLAAVEGDTATLTTLVAAVLADAPRPGAPATFTAEQIVQIVNLACTSPRSHGRPIDAWTPHELAAEAERQEIVTAISPTTVGRFLGRGRPQATSQPLLAQRQEQAARTSSFC
jgi:putative transposase